MYLTAPIRFLTSSPCWCGRASVSFVFLPDKVLLHVTCVELNVKAFDRVVNASAL